MLHLPIRKMVSTTDGPRAAGMGVAVLVFAIAFTGCDGLTGPEQPSYSAAELAHFEQLAGWRTYVDPDAELPLCDVVVRRWKGPIRIRVLGADQPYVDLIQSAALEIAAETGLDIEVAPPLLGDAILDFYFTSRAGLEEVAPDSRTHDVAHFTTWWSNEAIYAGRVLLIDAEVSDEMRPGVVRHQLMHVIGFPGHSDDPSSIMHVPWSGNVGFSDLDRAAMRMLYDPRIIFGMRLRQAVAALSDP